jgi:hypothetical protein
MNFNDTLYSKNFNLIFMGVVVILLFYIFHKINSENNINIENMDDTLEIDKISIDALDDLINHLLKNGITIPDDIISSGNIKGSQLCIGNTCINEDNLKKYLSPPPPPPKPKIWVCWKGSSLCGWQESW